MSIKIIREFWKLTSFSRGTFTVERSNTVNARSTIEASCASAVVDVHRTLRTRPSVHADAGKTTDRVGTSSTILTDKRPVGKDAKIDYEINKIFDDKSYLLKKLHDHYFIFA